MIPQNEDPEFEGIKTRCGRVVFCGRAQNEDPEFEGIKTSGPPLPAYGPPQNEDPEFEGIKTLREELEHQFHVLRTRTPNSRGLRR